MTFIQQQIKNIDARIAKWEENLKYDIQTGNDAEAEYSRRTLTRLAQDRTFWEEEAAAKANQQQ